MNGMESCLIKNCSPTLACLKPANLFNYSYSNERELSESLKFWNAQIKPKGVCLFVLRKSNERALIYVCRLRFLERELNDPQVVSFLSNYGYEDFDVWGAIEYLKTRFLSGENFPHEIGIFLGYPLEDVTGFINNEGKGFLCSGFWKVYGDINAAEKKFYKYKKCIAIYVHLWESGKSVRQLTVAA